VLTSSLRCIARGERSELAWSRTHALGPTGVSVGVFDGVHVGHREVIGQLIRASREGTLEPVVVTFDPHPAVVLRPENPPRLLFSLDRKLRALGALGVSEVVVVHFDQAMAELEAERFVEEVLVDGLKARLVVVGCNFHFGRGRRGNVELLKQMGGELGFDVAAVEVVQADGGTVSSSRIRQLIAAGSVGEARALLGDWFCLEGVVTTGDGRGKLLGFPTANLLVDPRISVPKEGVYAGWASVYGDPSRWPAAISIGSRPSFYSEAAPIVIEAHLVGFEGDLYGKRLEVFFVQRLRGQEAYLAPEELVEQMKLDVAESLSVLAQHGS
jgi:riboflavin kinase/FMN adenylyltransferase